MGFSLYFANFANGDIVDADRAGIDAFLAAQGLHVEGDPGDPGDTAIVDAAGRPLAFDGVTTDLRIDPLDQSGPVSGGIDHATLAPAECDFVYRLCEAGRMVIVNPQGDPMFIVVGHAHDQAHDTSAVPQPEDTVRVTSPEELGRVLGAKFEDFQTWLQRVRGDGGSDPVRS